MQYSADLVLEGGGVKGIALVAAGIPAKKLVDIIGSIQYPDFRHGSYYTRFPPGKAASLVIRSGVYLGEHLRSWLQSQLDDYGITTFADLPYTDTERPPTPERAYRLVVTASDISRGRLRYLPWDYDDFGRDRATQHVVEAVRASMSTPFF
ncbi:esterase, partial [Kocuria rosea]|nr:esterase [Kocuria rosea]